MRPGWNPVRRNRNIGTPAQGHGEDNRLTIPQSWHDRSVFYERLGACATFTQRVNGHCLRFFVEPTRSGWFHPCSVEDALEILAQVPAQDLAVLDFIVMRQPTRKQRILRPVWGRAVFAFEKGPHAGTAIVLEAQPLETTVWRKALDPQDQRELDRLHADGHQIRKTRRSITIAPTAASLRNTVLYRTLLHELGHHVDYRRFSAQEWDSRPSAQKEDYAHRYASEHCARLRQAGVVPFDPQRDAALRQEYGLKDQWFLSPQGTVEPWSCSPSTT
ncbi:hypothetical protein PMI14_01101 [Acidovorax sp. CF316]|nr:hypothetical protein PMI14_01101 [Acidovorax sp. CF316]